MPPQAIKIQIVWMAQISKNEIVMGWGAEIKGYF